MGLYYRREQIFVFIRTSTFGCLRLYFGLFCIVFQILFGARRANVILKTNIVTDILKCI